MSEYCVNGCEEKALYEDPCTPPMELGKCLCIDCYKGSLDVLIDGMQDQIADLQQERSKL